MSVIVNMFRSNPLTNLFRNNQPETVQEENTPKTKAVRYGKQTLWDKSGYRQKLPAEFLNGEQIYTDSQESRYSKSKKHIERKFYVLPSGNVIPARKTIPAKNVKLSVDALPAGKSKASVRFISSPRQASGKAKEMSIENASGSIVIHYHGKRLSNELHEVNLERDADGNIIITPTVADGEKPAEAQEGAEVNGNEVEVANATGTAVIKKFVKTGDAIEPEPELDATTEETKTPVAEVIESETSDESEELLEKTKVTESNTCSLYRILGMSWMVVGKVASAILCPVRSLSHLFCCTSYFRPKIKDSEEI